MVKNSPKKNKGAILVLSALFMSVLIGMSALAVDVGLVSVVKNKAKIAADAASLAGALSINSLNAAENAVFEMAEKNGFGNGENNTTVTMQINPTGNNANWVKTTIQTQVPFTFSRIFGLENSTVTASSTAEFNAYAPLNINLGGIFGSAPRPVNLFVYGPYAPHSYGDPFSAKYLNNGTRNSDYGEGYNFQIYVPENYRDYSNTKILQVELFDPDTYNAGGYVNPNGTTRIDQYLGPRYTDSGYTSRYTKTVYALYAPDNTPNDLADDVLIARATYQYTSTTDMRWTTPSGFNFNTQRYGAGNYRLNVMTIDGSSGNGFTLRSGPPNYSRNRGRRGVLTDGFDPNNGTIINASGKLPINFNAATNTSLLFGEVPTEAAGKNLYLDKFDTDINSRYITYTCSSLPNQSWRGVLARDDQWVRDTISVPANYTSGSWYGTYSAGFMDTSAWMMTYDGFNSGGSGGIVRLVQ